MNTQPETYEPRCVMEWAEQCAGADDMLDYLERTTQTEQEVQHESA